MFKAVIFDMDGVMVDSELAHSAAYSRVLREYGVEPVMNEHGTYNIAGLTLKETWEIFKKRHSIDEDTDVLMNKKRLAFSEEIEKSGIQALPGLLDLLKDLSEHNVKIAVATSANTARVNLVLERLKIKTSFSVMVTADDVQKGKPDPEVYIKAALKLGLTSDECVVIEDAEEGVKAGVAAKMRVVAVPNVHTKKMDFSSATKIVPSLKELDYNKLNALFDRYIVHS